MSQQSIESNPNPFFSIIVPAYNVEPYILECLESIKKQTFENFEVIVVNDGSTDDTEKLIKSFISADRRFALFSQENKGLSQTRNYSLTQARGYFVLFVDSDDAVVPNYLEFIEHQSRINKAEMIHFGADIIDENVDTFYEKKNKYHRKLDNSDQNLQLNLLENHNFMSSVCLYAISRKYIKKHSLYFEAKIIHEDEIYTLKAIAKTKKHSIIRKVLYLRRIRVNSIMTAPASQNNVDSMVITTVKASDLFKELRINKPTDYKLLCLINKRILKYYRKTLGYIRRSNTIKANILSTLKLTFKIVPHIIFAISIILKRR